MPVRGFTGKTQGKRVLRKGREREKYGPHKNKYKPVNSQKPVYIKEDKTYRDLPLEGRPGEIIPKGTLFLFHSRRYRLMEDTEICSIGTAAGTAVGRFKLEK